MQVKLTTAERADSASVRALSFCLACSWLAAAVDQEQIPIFILVYSAVSIFTQTMTAGAAHKKYDNIILLTAKIFTRNARQATDVTEREHSLFLFPSLSAKATHRQHAACTSCSSLLVMAIKMWQVAWLRHGIGSISTMLDSVETVV